MMYISNTIYLAVIYTAIAYFIALRLSLFQAIVFYAPVKNHMDGYKIIKQTVQKKLQINGWQIRKKCYLEVPSEQEMLKRSVSLFSIFCTSPLFKGSTGFECIRLKCLSSWYLWPNLSWHKVHLRLLNWRWTTLMCLFRCSWRANFLPQVLQQNLKWMKRQGLILQQESQKNWWNSDQILNLW